MASIAATLSAKSGRLGSLEQVTGRNAPGAAFGFETQDRNYTVLIWQSSQAADQIEILALF
ncbi:hypothetical protein I603_0193 [Erythrobacter dokdonensis DSW-74]|uniref:Uncharacterized protein n=2 Tax=Erythrobacter TaxID=1041 RepID=A0A1A7BKQ0_9SPHN|nr:hypothetical protein I603_0193 [Erythrobacter dokdonensis DSW-74]